MKKEELIKKKNVVAVIPGQKVTGGINTGRDAMVVYVLKKVPLSELSEKDIIPKTIEGFESDVQESNEINALAVDRTKKWRPMPGGVSAGHYNITTGTPGTVVKKNNIRHSLSNNHVYADSNHAHIYDPILQPGPYDGGTSNDIIANLAAFVKINFVDDPSTCPLTRLYIWVFNSLARLFHRYSRISSYSSEINKVDCAIALPVFDEDISDEILEIGEPTGFNFSELKAGDAVKKSGRTTGVTEGTVIGSTGIAKVNYGDKVAVFENQIFTTPIAQGGDSGSIVLNEKNEVVGLLFAGSDSLTIVNKIQDVIEALGLDKSL